VHCAARIRTGTLEDFEQDNVRVTARLSAAPHLVHLSTVAVYGHRPQNRADETTPLRPEGLYATSKAASETEANGATILRLGPVWGGPYDDRLLSAIDRLVRTRLVVLPGPCRSPMPLVHVHNVALAVAGALQHRVLGAFNVTDDTGWSLWDLVDRVAAARGLPGPRAHLPLGLAKGLAGLSTRALGAVGRGSPFRPEIVALMNTACTFDITAARTRLGYAPVDPELLLRARCLDVGQNLSSAISRLVKK